MNKSEMIEDIETLIKANRDNPNINAFWLAHMIREVIKFELEEVNNEQSDFRKTNAEGYEEKRFS